MADHRGSIASPRARPRTRIEDDSAIETEYHLGEMLGKGAFGVVWEASNRSTDIKYAIKMVPKDKPGSMAIQLLEREIQVLNHVNHPHIIQLIEVFETPKKVFMVLEMCRGGELSDLLKQRKSFKEEDVKIIMRQLAEAIVYMHDKDMVHRDLKLENILLANPESAEPFNIKVTDFGLSHMKGLPGCEDLMSSRCGTLYYMAPEVLKNKLEYSKLCDVWSAGVIMYALLCGKMPFNGETAVQLEDQILQGELKFKEAEWLNISEGAKELIRGMLHVSTINRLTARQILEDPWITGGATRKRIDPLMMLMDDSPSPSPPQVRSNVAATFPASEKSDVASTTTVTTKSKEQLETPSRSKSISHSTSASRMPPTAARKTSSQKKVSSSVSTGRLHSSRASTAQSHRNSTSSSHTGRKPSSAKPSQT